MDVAPNGDLYVTDVYSSDYVHRFDSRAPQDTLRCVPVKHHDTQRVDRPSSLPANEARIM
jgi:hypothetical protein